MKLSTFLAVAHGSFEWGIDAQRVERIVDRNEHSGASPFDLAIVLGAPSRATDADRVLVVRARQGALELQASRLTRLRSHPADEVLALPGLVFPGKAVPLALAGVVMSESSRPLFIIDADGLWETVLLAVNSGGDSVKEMVRS